MIRRYSEQNRLFSSPALPFSDYAQSSFRGRTTPFAPARSLFRENDQNRCRRLVPRAWLRATCHGAGCLTLMFRLHLRLWRCPEPPETSGCRCPAVGLPAILVSPPSLFLQVSTECGSVRMVSSPSNHGHHLCSLLPESLLGIFFHSLLFSFLMLLQCFSSLGK